LELLPPRAVDRAGAVASSVSTSEELDDGALLACVAKRFRELAFPAPDAVITVVYPLAFSPERELGEAPRALRGPRPRVRLPVESPAAPFQIARADFVGGALGPRRLERDRYLVFLTPAPGRPARLVVEGLGAREVLELRGNETGEVARLDVR